MFVSQQLFTATDGIGFSYGVTWNTVRRNIFNWKLGDPQITQISADSGSGSNNLRPSAKSADKYSAVPSRLEAKVKSFCAIPQARQGGTGLRGSYVQFRKEESSGKDCCREWAEELVGGSNLCHGRFGLE